MPELHLEEAKPETEGTESIPQQEPVDELKQSNPLSDSLTKLKEISNALRKLGEDLSMLVTLMEQVSTVTNALSSGERTSAAHGIGSPLAMLSSLLSRKPDGSSPGPDLNQLLLTLLSQEYGKGK